jgi:glycerol kinase
VSVLAIDVGTTSVRVGVVRPDGTVAARRSEALVLDRPSPGLAEFDADALRRTVVRLSVDCIDEAGRVDAVGIAVQRASVVAWDPVSRTPLHAAISWQDLRTIGDCLTIAATHGIRLAANQTATKAGWLLRHLAGTGRDTSNVRIGTLDTWLIDALSNGAAFVTEPSNAAVTGLVDPESIVQFAWSPTRCTATGVPIEALAPMHASPGPLAVATALPGAPPIVAALGDQQASLIGQGALDTAVAKLTLGTSAIADAYIGTDTPALLDRATHGSYPVVAHSVGGVLHWAREAVILTAGTCIDWLVDDLALLANPAESESVAASVTDTDGAWFVPAMLGLGTPHWDYGARGTLLGLTRGTTRAHVVRAVLRGIAHRSADLLDAMHRDGAGNPSRLRIDGAMSRNAVLVDELANATGCTIDVCDEREATLRGAGFAAGVAVGAWPTLAYTAHFATVRESREPTISDARRAEERSQWHEAVSRAQGWIPELSALDF